ncbi:MAG TPA: hypothetical protein PLA90_08720 [Candidatus Sumerlaeota bacterium]|nr:hypothetical protein [Candidatus Sumerlaeota bacterium]
MRSSTRGTLAVLALIVAGVFVKVGLDRQFTVYSAKPANAATTSQTAVSTQPPPAPVAPMPQPASPVSEGMKKADAELGLGDVNLDDVSLDMDLTAPTVSAPPPPTPTPPPTPAPASQPAGNSESLKKADAELGLGDVNLDDVSLDMDLTAPGTPSAKKTPAPSVTAQTSKSQPVAVVQNPSRTPAPTVKTPAANPVEDKALSEQAISGGAESQWVADTDHQTSVTELGMIAHATTGGVARTNGLLHLTGKKACPT